ncbi:MAG TPA: LuxR C-terminal-related transcriptional regulator [Gaiellaceae bacterium]
MDERAVERLLAEQRRYYGERAPEYDDWWSRRARYHLDAESAEGWFADVAELEAELERFAPRGDVLELAAGTGNWTRRLVRHADRVTAVDAVPEVLELNRAKLGAAVDFVLADVFAWEPSRAFDVCFFGFWLSHVPSRRFEAFWQLVDRALKPDGRVFLVDNAHLGDPRHTVSASGEVVRRSLSDGREFDIVKRFWTPAELERELAALGWQLNADATANGHFVFASGQRRRDHASVDVVDASLLDEAWRALEKADWERARRAFAAVLERGELAEALDGGGLAAWFMGDLDDGVALRERAVARYSREGDCSRAARVALWISRMYLNSGRASAAGGWLSRAERILADEPSCAGHGWLAVERARRAASVEEAAERAREALELARRFGDDDLEVFALSVLGRAEVSAGRAEEGSRKLEEAMAAASAGRIRNLHTLGEAYCNLITACTAAGDWERASEWCRHVDAFAKEREITVLYGACRTIHADVLLASGRWDDAEQALEDALEAHRRRYPAMAAPTVSTLALLRIRQGRLAEAEQLLAGREEQPLALLALAELRLADAEPAAAAALLERALADTGDDVLTEARVLAPLVDARLAAQEPTGARHAVERLEQLAAASARRLVEARAALAGARLALAGGAVADARERAHEALAAFGALEMPFEAAEARLELARALADEVPELALEEARAAFAAFKRLGAERAMDAAAAVRRGLGAGTAAEPQGYGELTTREGEVLALVARGLTNARIAEALFISEKTAGHHVSRILSKLGVRNRAEAATHAARLGLAPDPSSDRDGR